MRRRVPAALAPILLLAGIVRFWGLGFGMPHTQARPDETFIIDVARSFLRGDFSPPFYDYPWLYMWAVSGVYFCYYLWGLATGAFHSIADLLASWPVHWSPFFLLSRGVSALAGTATVAVVFYIGRRLWDDATGLVAAFFLSVAFLHVRDSHFGTTDVAMTLLIVLAIAFLIEAHREGRPSRFLAAGIFGGLAAATKYSALLVPVAMLGSQALHVLDSRDPRWRAAFDGRLLWFGVPFVLAFGVGVPFVLLDTGRFLDAMRALQDSMAIGTPALGLHNGLAHHVEFSLRYGLGLPLLLAGLAGALVLFRADPKGATLLLSFPIAYYLVAGSIRNLFFRYAIPLVPFLCLTAAYLVCRTIAHLPIAAGQTDRKGSRWAFAVVTSIVAGAVALPSALSVSRFDRLLSETDNRVMVAKWFERHVPPGSSVLQSGSLFGHAQIDGRVYRNWVWDRTRLIFLLDRQPATGRPDWILVQDSPLPSETQAIVKQLLTEDYVLVHRFEALSLEVDHVFDRQDAFFVPFAGFDEVKRPGPNFSLFKRAGAPAS